MFYFLKKPHQNLGHQNFGYFPPKINSTQISNTFLRKPNIPSPLKELIIKLTKSVTLFSYFFFYKSSFDIFEKFLLFCICWYLFYSRLAFIFHLLRDSYIVHDHVLAFFVFSSSIRIWYFILLVGKVTALFRDFSNYPDDSN